MEMSKSDWRKPNVQEKEYLNQKLKPDAILNTVLYGILECFLLLLIYLFGQMYFENRTMTELIITLVVVIPLAVLAIFVGKIVYNYTRRLNCLSSGDYLVAVTVASEVRPSLAIKRTVDYITFKPVDDTTFTLPSNGFFKQPVEEGQRIWLVDYNNRKKGCLDYLQVP